MTISFLDDHFKLLVEAGFIAVNQADEDSARKLFSAAQALAPELSLPQVGFGYLHFHKLELAQACKILQRVLDKEPDNDMCKVFLGICTGMQPNLVEKGEELLDRTLKTKDPLVKQLAYTAIDFIERIVKKSPGPAAVQKKK